MRGLLRGLPVPPRPKTHTLNPRNRICFHGIFVKECNDETPPAAVGDVVFPSFQRCKRFVQSRQTTSRARFTSSQRRHLRHKGDHSSTRLMPADLPGTEASEADLSANPMCRPAGSPKPQSQTWYITSAKIRHSLTPHPVIKRLPGWGFRCLEFRGLGVWGFRVWVWGSLLIWLGIVTTGDSGVCPLGADRISET